MTKLSSFADSSQFGYQGVVVIKTGEEEVVIEN